MMGRDSEKELLVTDTTEAEKGAQGLPSGKPLDWVYIDFVQALIKEIKECASLNDFHILLQKSFNSDQMQEA